MFYFLYSRLYMCTPMYCVILPVKTDQAEIHDWRCTKQYVQCCVHVTPYAAKHPVTQQLKNNKWNKVKKDKDVKEIKEPTIDFRDIFLRNYKKQISLENNFFPVY